MTSHQSGLKRPFTFTRAVFLCAGFLLVFLAAVGVVLPVLPTTPLLILAAACFARSSPTFYRWLLDNRLFGPYLVQWRRDYSVPREAKRKAYEAAEFLIERDPRPRSNRGSRYHGRIEGGG